MTNGLAVAGTRAILSGLNPEPSTSPLPKDNLHYVTVHYDTERYWRTREICGGFEQYFNGIPTTTQEVSMFFVLASNNYIRDEFIAQLQ